jgi:hypothetical protein
VLRLHGIAAASLAGVLVIATVPIVGAADKPDAKIAVQVRDALGRALPGRRVMVTTHWSTEKESKDHGGRSLNRVFRTDSRGSARGPIKLTRDERASVRLNNDWLNLTVLVFDEHGRPAGIAATTRYLGTEPDQLEQQEAAGPIEVRSPVVRAPEPNATALASCSYYWEHFSYPTGYMQVGELHKHRDAPTARFTYRATADSSVDVMTTSSFESAWTVSGSFHVGNSADSSVAANALTDDYHWALRSEFQFEKVRLYKDCVGGPYHAWTGIEELGVQRWLEGGMTLANTLAQPSLNLTYAQQYGPGTEYHRAANAFTKWSAAISISGATIGARSGASSYVKLDYVFGSRSNHYLYGISAKPSTATRVFQSTP